MEILSTTRQVEFLFVRLHEWKILCWILHTVFPIRKLHIIKDNHPLQACPFGWFVLFGERITLFTTWQVEIPSDNCILLYWRWLLAFSSQQTAWSENKHRRVTQGNVYLYLVVCVSRELTVPLQYTEFQKQSMKINVEEKEWETPIHQISKAISENKHRG